MISPGTLAATKVQVVKVLTERGWHSRLVRGLRARGPEFDSRISHPCFDFFPFCVAEVALNTRKNGALMARGE